MFRKKAFIYNWWVGTKSERNCFVDIFSKECVTNGCIVVGQVHSPFYDMETSRNPVVKVTKRGIITASGRFYPYSTAHPLYLMYLNEIHSNERGCVAFNWCESRTVEKQITADVLFPNGEYKENITFDFESLIEQHPNFLGFSNTLQSRVVFNTFDTRPFKPEYKGWISPNEVRESAEKLADYQKEIVRRTTNLFKMIK